MRFHKWLDQLRQRTHQGNPLPAARRREPVPVQVPSELLEARRVLSVSTLFIGGELSVVIDGADAVVVRPNPADTTPLDGVDLQVLENGVATTTIGSVSTQTVQRINIRGGGGANLIDLSAVTAGLFSNVVSIRIDGADGADTLVGSADLNDTIIGSDGDDSITGGAGANVIDAGDGNDLVQGGAGNDRIDAGDGNDLVTAGDGADSVLGGHGDDTLSGDAGDDSIAAGDGEDLLNGNDGNDSLSGDDGSDSINGDTGLDLLLGGSGNDSLAGGDDVDTLRGTAGNDTLNGDLASDFLYGGEGNDSLSGGDGDDFAEAGTGNDTVLGEDGADSLLGGGGNDSVVGGEGADNMSGNGGNDTMQGSNGLDVIRGGAGNDLVDATDDTATTPGATVPQARLFAVADDNTNSIVELDPVSGLEINRFPAPETISRSGDGLAFDGTRLFFLNGNGTDTLFELDPDLGTVIDQDPITVGSRNYEGLATLGGQLFFLDYSAADIYQFDPASDSVTNRLDINGQNPTVSLLQGGLAGIANPDALVVVEAGGNRVHFVNPTTGSLTGSFTPLTLAAGSYFGAGVIDGEIYLGSDSTTVIDVFSRTGILQRTINLSYPVSALGADDIGSTGTPGGGGSTLNSFNIDLTFGPTISTAQQDIFRRAADRWESIIVGDVPDVIVPGIGQVDDISIDFSTTTIDVVGNILANTQLIAVRVGTFIPSAADIQFDALDIDNLDSAGQLEIVALHEIGHALGFGTVWNQLGLIGGAGGTDPQFRGANAIAEYNARFGTNAQGVPVENIGGPGSVDSHWRESVLTNELMTSVLSTGANPLTRLTIAQFQDLGYQVDYSQADALTSATLSAVDIRTNGRSRIGTGTGAVPTEFNEANLSAGRIAGRTVVGTAEPMLVVPGASLAKSNNGVTTVTREGWLAQERLFAINSRLQIPETEVNDTIATAMNVDGSFSLDADPNIGDSVSDTSTTIPHVSIQGTGNDSYDYYSFTVTNAGDRGIFDIDFTSGGLDSEIFLFDSTGTFLIGDDDGITLDSGSTTGLDSFLEVTFTAPGTYTIGVAGFPSTGANGGITGATVPSGTTYTLHVSIENHAVGAPTPVTPPAPALQFGDTLLGDDGNDTLLGSPGDDNITGGYGNDSIVADDGADQIYGGDGNDSIDAGAGDDLIIGHKGADSIQPGDGDDSIRYRARDGQDTVLDSLGLDTVDINGTAAADTFSIGQTGDQLIVGLLGNDIRIASGTTVVNVNGLAGNDVFNVGDLNQLTGLKVNLVGGAGNDTFNAAGSNIGTVRLTFDAGEGANAILGSNNDETIIGGSGNDVINGGGGNDSILGGGGDDVLTGGAGNDTLDGGTGSDTLLGSDGDDVLVGGANADSLVGGNGNDNIIGDAGNDTAFGDAGNDTLQGVAGNDILNGGIGDDVVLGGTDNDIIFGLDGSDSLLGGDGDDSIDGGAAGDVIDGGDGNDTVAGAAGNDTLDGGDGEDLVTGSLGDDYVLGGDGHDTLLGQAGNDVVLGGDGNDLLNAGGGRDTLAGGEGSNGFTTDSLDRINEAFSLPVEVAQLLASLPKIV